MENVLTKVFGWLADLAVPTDPAEFWTMLQALFAGGLLVVAAKGLKSLRIAKNDVQTRSIREAKAHALGLVKEFVGLIDEHDPINDRMANAVSAPFVPNTEPGDFFASKPDEVEMEKIMVWLQQIPPDLWSQTARMLNRLEAWASPFVCGVADPDVAYGPCAPPFRKIITQHYAMLVFMRDLPSAGNYPNVVTLFNSWNERLDTDGEAQTLFAALNDMINRYQAVRKKVPQHDLNPPIGTKLDD